MALISSKLTWKKDEVFGDGREDPTLTITITGWSDVIRFTERMKEWQCEFMDEGVRIQNRFKHKYGAKRFRELINHYTGRVPLR